MQKGQIVKNIYVEGISGSILLVHADIVADTFTRPERVESVCTSKAFSFDDKSSNLTR